MSIQKVRELKDKMSLEYSDELTKCGVFYAFSNSQFEEYKTYKEDGDDTYLSLGGGAIISKKDLLKYETFTKEIAPSLKKEFASKVKKDELILYELLNHECFYTGDYDDILDIIIEYFEDTTVEDIKRVYEENCREYCD